MGLEMKITHQAVGCAATSAPFCALEAPRARFAVWLVLALVLAATSCIAPYSVGPYVESIVPPRWGNDGHDFIGVGGVEAVFPGGLVLGAGVMHPDDGREEYLLKVGYQVRLR